MSGIAYNVTHTRVVINNPGTGAHQLVAGIPGVRIRVVDLALSANAAVNVKFQSHTVPTDLTGLFYFGSAGQNIVLPFNDRGWFTALVGEDLDINLSGAVAVGGVLHYVTIT